MYPLKYYLILLLAISHFKSWAQTNDERTERPLQIKAAAVGSLIYPGLKLGIEIPVKFIEMRKNAGAKIIHKERFLNVNYGFYHHATFHTNHWFTAEWLKRRSRADRGFFTQSAIGLGYSRTFLGGTTYEVDDDKEVKKIPMAGHHYLHFTTGLGLGYDFSKKHPNSPLALYSHLNVMVLYPHNSFVYLRPTLEIGGILKLDQTSITTRKRIKIKK